MRLAIPAPPEMYPWLAQRARLVVDRSFRAIAAIGDDGQIKGMVGYDAFTSNSCAIHVAADDPGAIRSLLRAGFELPFERLGFGVVFCAVISTNVRSLRLVRGLGFRELATLRDQWSAGVDTVLFEMRREDCRWIRKQRKMEAA